MRGAANANALLLPVVAAFPITMPQLDRARIHEFHGFVRRKAGYQNALTSYQNAANFYAILRAQGGHDAKEADAGLHRVASTIAEINQTINGNLGEGSSLQGARPIQQA